MKDANYQLLCTVLMGVASLFRFIGYNLSTFIIESLLHSAHVRDPGAIIMHAGYYGQAVKELSTSLSTLIVPVFLNFVSPKWTLVIGSFMIAVYFASFFFLSNALYFTANILLGISAALIYTSFYSCQMAFSTRETLARNSARIQGIANLSLISGGLLYMCITKIHATGIKDSNEHYRYYSEDETRTMWAFLFTFCLINLVKNCVDGDHLQIDAIRQLKLTLSTLIDQNILLLVPRFVNNGLLVSFFMNVYPTSLQYSTTISKPYPMIAAYYSFSMCAGSTLLITVPNSSTAHPTADKALLEPRLLWVCVIAFLLGMADSANGASGVVLCSRILPHRTAHTYSAARFYRGITSTTIFFCSSVLTMSIHAVILISATLISLITFNYVLKNIENREEEKLPYSRKSSTEQTELDK